MSFDSPRDVNPFEAPRAGIGQYAAADDYLESESDAEIIRRAHIGHEASIKSLGLLNFFFAFFGLLGTLALLAMGVGLIPMPPSQDPNSPSPEAMRGIFLGLSLVYLAMTVLNGGMGYGLRALQPWARWTTVVLTALSMLYILGVSVVLALAQPAAGLFVLMLGSLILGYILYLMISAKGGMVFSSQYKMIIRKTPHVKYKTSLIVKIFLGLLLFVIGLAIVGALVNMFQTR
ncbi:hypothetical protein P12x_001199 [Tundrisphaera lichenicola]|uniref:hypothetical protein n=1 Tax=Tundrisphaera lichenicola TaxID=2029860 RepID=UPI003EB769B1